MNVYFTVDTESSMAGAWSHPERRPLTADRHIFCRIGEEDYGIGLITRVLSEHGFRATHFVETLATLVNGEDDSKRVFDYLLEHNQDVQLHVHPTYRDYSQALRAGAAGQTGEPSAAADFLGTFHEARQMELLEEAGRLYRQFAGRPPVAFRAGCFAASRATLRCLSRLGIRLDSSFNPCYRTWSFAGENLEPNRVCQVEGVWEIPITVARTPLLEGHGGLKFADPCALSVRELQVMLEAGAKAGQRHFVIVFHCFAAVKAKDYTYSQIKPDRIVIRRLEKLMEYLEKRADLFRVSTFGELAREISLLEAGEAPLSNLGLAAAAVRKSVQGMNRNYWF